MIDGSVSHTLANIPALTQFSSRNPASRPMNSIREKFISQKTLVHVIRTTNNKKSSGPDTIPNCILRKLDKFNVQSLRILFNHCINVGYFPVSWRQANIVPVVKPRKSPKDPSNYRPISLLSNISKLFEQCLLLKLEDGIVDKKITKDFQMGFKKHHSTLHPLLYFSSHVANSLNKRLATIATFIDIKKAFDSVYTNGLLHKMIRYGIDFNLVNILQSYLSDRPLG